MWFSIGVRQEGGSLDRQWVETGEAMIPTLPVCLEFMEFLITLDDVDEDASRCLLPAVCYRLGTVLSLSRASHEK